MPIASGRAPRTALLGLLCLVVAACDLAAGSPAGSPSPLASVRKPRAHGGADRPFPDRRAVGPPIGPAVDRTQPGVASSGADDPGPVLDEDLPFDAATQRRCRRCSTRLANASRPPASRSPSGLADGRVWTGISGASPAVAPTPGHGRDGVQHRDHHQDLRDARWCCSWWTKASSRSTTGCPVPARLPRRQAHHHPAAAGHTERRRSTTSRARATRARRSATPTASGPTPGDPATSWTHRTAGRGRCFHYSNTNFVLLGEVVEKVTGRAVSEVIRDRLLDPLGLEHTSYQPDERTPANAAHGHLWGGGTTFYDQTEGDRWLPHMSAAIDRGRVGRHGLQRRATSRAGRWRCTARTRWSPTELLEAMTEFRAKDEYGLGTRTRIFYGRRAFGHGGSLRGYEDAGVVLPAGGRRRSCCSPTGACTTPTRPSASCCASSGSTSTCPRPQYDSEPQHQRLSRGVARLRGGCVRRVPGRLRTVRPRSGQGAYSQAPTNWTGRAPHWDLNRYRFHSGCDSSVGRPGASWLSTPLRS